MNRVTVPISPCGVPYSSTVLCGGLPVAFDLRREMFVCTEHMRQAENAEPAEPQSEEEAAIAAALHIAREHQRQQREQGE